MATISAKEMPDFLRKIRDYPGHPITKSAAPIWMYIQAPGVGLHSLLGACMVEDKYKPPAPAFRPAEGVVSFVQY